MFEFLKKRRPIHLRVEHALTLAQKGSPQSIADAILCGDNHPSTNEAALSLALRMQNPHQRVRIVGFRDVRADELCRACQNPKKKSVCMKPPRAGYIDRDADDAYVFDLYPSFIPVTVEEIRSLRHNWQRRR